METNDKEPRLVRGNLDELDKLDRIKHDDERIVERVMIEGQKPSRYYYLGCFIKDNEEIKLRYMVNDNGIIGTTYQRGSRTIS